jgi:hypothetical protein
MKRPLGLNKADISIELTPDISNGVQQQLRLLNGLVILFGVEFF